MRGARDIGTDRMRVAGARPLESGLHRGIRRGLAGLTSAISRAPTDPQIADIALTAHNIDIDRGKLAPSKTKNAEVKQFAPQAGRRPQRGREGGRRPRHAPGRQARDQPDLEEPEGRRQEGGRAAQEGVGRRVRQGLTSTSRSRITRRCRRVKNVLPERAEQGPGANTAKKWALPHVCGGGATPPHTPRRCAAESGALPPRSARADREEGAGGRDDRTCLICPSAHDVTSGMFLRRLAPELADVISQAVFHITRSVKSPLH